ncbi:MAG: aminotransferase class I/II-fold pyridoxal phosphate-dependent enzyme, partial [SAR324 cluster bacterium]|nr:aminotransferase class I/II-fold pyridoxal phosphate-dependent enzyme [SAR324 cluster bacterium]
CNPNNPTGTVYTRKEIETLLNICEEHNLFLLSDEAYREFVYDDLEPLSILNVAPNNPRVVVLDSLSKRFSLCGARLGCLISTNEEFMARVLCFAQARLSVSTLEQFAAAYMMERISQDFIIAVREEYQKRRDTLSDALQSIPGVFARRTQGAFYMIIRLPVNDADAFAAYMLEEVSFKGATTFVAPASGFYLDNSRGKNEVRAAYVLEQADIINAVEVLEYALKQFKSSHG